MSDRLTIAAYEDVTINVTMVDNRDISADTFTFTLRKKDRTLVLTKTVGSGITITSNGSVSSVGAISIAIPSADTDDLLVGEIYVWDLWRTTASALAQLADGTLMLRIQQRVNPA